STVSKKRTRRTPGTARKRIPNRESKVGDMTVDELQMTITATVENTLAQWLGDPDEGLELRPEIVERLKRQEQEYAAGQRGRSLDEVVKEMGLE
ncbi:MAG: hypothetical protein M1482_09075, partial [Chloroflexi bacterium]|nr:hypothetical protein [Chloroflexota bacterium]